MFTPWAHLDENDGSSNSDEQKNVLEAETGGNNSVGLSHMEDTIHSSPPR